jgi:uncharacterized membrane protein
MRRFSFVGVIATVIVLSILMAGVCLDRMFALGGSTHAGSINGSWWWAGFIAFLFFGVNFLRLLIQDIHRKVALDEQQRLRQRQLDNLRAMIPRESLGNQVTRRR